MSSVKKYLRTLGEDKKKGLLVRVDTRLIDSLNRIDERLSELGLAKISRSQVIEDALNKFIKNMNSELKNLEDKNKDDKEEGKDGMDKDSEVSEETKDSHEDEDEDEDGSSHGEISW